MKNTMRSVWIVMLLLVVTTLACNLSVITDRVQESIGDAPPEAATLPPPPTPTATLVITPSTETPPDETAPPTEEPPAEAGQQEEATSPENAGEQPPESAQPPAGEGEAEVIESLQLPGLGLQGNGLTGLKTFRQRMKVHAVGNAGAEISGYEYRADVNTEQKAIHAYITLTAPAAESMPGEQMEMIVIDDRLWLKIGNQPWLPIPQEMSGASIPDQMISAGDILPFVPQAKRVMPDEEINGVMAHHYHYELNNFQAEGVTMTGSGDVYVAVDGGYVARWTFTGQGQLREDISGEEVTLEYDTYDVDTAIDIQPPR